MDRGCSPQNRPDIRVSEAPIAVAPAPVSPISHSVAVTNAVGKQPVRGTRLELLLTNQGAVGSRHAAICSSSPPLGAERPGEVGASPAVVRASTGGSRGAPRHASDRAAGR